jgi:hypothetical protein
VSSVSSISLLFGSLVYANAEAAAAVFPKAAAAVYPEAAAYLAGGSSGSAAVFAGGSTSSDCGTGFVSSVLDLPSSAARGQLSVARCGLAAASVAGYDTVVFAGGNSRLGYVATVDVFVNQTSQPGHLKLSEARSWIEGSGSPTRAFFVGGYQKRTASKSTAVDVYDAETKTMSAAAPLPSGRMFHAVATTSSMGVDTLFVGGGTDDDDVTNAVSVLTIGSHHAAGAVKAGSGTEAAAGADADAWRGSKLTSSRTRLAGATARTARGDQYVSFAGGEGSEDGGPGWSCAGSFCMSDQIDVFNATGGFIPTAPKLQLSEPRSRLAGVALGCKVVFAGGKTLTGYSSAVDVVDFCGTYPTVTTTHMAVARADLAAAALGGGSVALVGGQNSSGTTDAVEELKI